MLALFQIMSLGDNAGAGPLFPLPHTVSGVSSGASIAANQLMAYSEVVRGAAFIAGSPYGCGNAAAVPNSWSCSYNKPPLDLQSLYAYAAARATAGQIDALSHLVGKPLYLYSGTKDTIVFQAEMDRTAAYFSRYVGAANIEYVAGVPSEHGYITDGYGECCGCLNGSFILNCEYDQAGAVLRKVLGGSALEPRAPIAPAAQLVEVSQYNYRPKARAWGSVQMSDNAFVYVPSACAAALGGCRVHVNYHGCRGGKMSNIGPLHYGYNEWAESNQIVVVYPQATNGTGNPHGCWDWTGVTGSNFDSKTSSQLVTVLSLINDLEQAIAAGPTNSTDSALPTETRA